MKKFEEEVKRPSNAGIDPFSKRDVSFEKLSNKFIKGAQTLKEWKEYAFKAEDRIRELEAQLEKQQPEVPKFVAEYIEAAKEDCWTLFNALDDSLSLKVGNWLRGGNFSNQEILAQAWIHGYTVAKEKRFYLKNKLTGNFLVKWGDSLSEVQVFCLQEEPEEGQFTQQEIDSMETGSYEQIEVGDD